MHGAIRSISMSSVHACAGGSGTSKELSNSIRQVPLCRADSSAGLIRGVAWGDGKLARLGGVDQLEELLRRDRDLADAHAERPQCVLDRRDHGRGARNGTGLADTFDAE